MGIRYGYRSRHGVGARPGISPGFSLLVLALVAGAVVPATRTAALVALAALALIGVGSFLVALSPGASLVVVGLVVGVMVPAARAAALIALGVLALVGVVSLFLRLDELLGSERLALASRALVAALPVGVVVWGGLTDGEWVWELVVILGLSWLGTYQLIDWADPLGWRARRAYKTAASYPAPTLADDIRALTGGDGRDERPAGAPLEGGSAEAWVSAGRPRGAAAGERGEAPGTVVRAPRRRSGEEILAELDDMPGLEQVAERMRELVAAVEINRQRRRAGLPAGALGLHLALVGPPGSGKTTVARLVGELYLALGLVDHGHLVEADRGGLVGEHVGETNPKTHRQIDRAMGGVLLIDEAHALAEGDRRHSFDAEAISALAKRMEDDAGRWACVLAGHTEGMQRMLDSDAKLRGHVSQTIEFPDYQLDTLMAIADRTLVQSDYEFGEGARGTFEHGLRELRSRDEWGWGNAREVDKLIEHATRAHALRLREAGSKKADAGQLRTLRLADVQVALERSRAERPESDAPPYDFSGA